MAKAPSGHDNATGDADASMFEWVGPESAEEINSTHTPNHHFWREALRRMVKSHVTLACLIVLVALILVAIFVPIFSPWSISDQDRTEINMGAFSGGHIFGTDNLGRDLFVRTCFGMRVSLVVAFFAVLINLIVGAIYGGIAGYLGNLADMVMMRILEVISCIPSLIMVVLLLMVMKPGVKTIILAFALVGWTDMARLVRGEVLKLKSREYVLASRVLGGTPLYVITHDLLPNAASVILVELTMCIPGAILMEGFLSYLGLGVQIPLASLGTLISDGIKGFQSNPILLLAPSVFLVITMVVFNVLGDTLRDILDPLLGRQ